jgi:flavin reductase (DIM6/NTAB) family NADH-FMN oxidoreductase RutF
MADGSARAPERNDEGNRPMESFRPGPETARALRDALGCFGTGVTVVTCMTGDGPLAMTANSFSSVSLDPPLVLWSPAIASSRHDAFVAAQTFSIHVLAADQLALARAFARDGRDFSHAGWHETDHGTPAIAGAIARFDCQHHAAHGAGDHTIVLGRVEGAAHRPGAPLLFVRGCYGCFSDQDFTNGG